MLWLIRRPDNPKQRAREEIDANRDSISILWVPTMLEKEVGAVTWVDAFLKYVHFSCPPPTYTIVFIFNLFFVFVKDKVLIKFGKK